MILAPLLEALRTSAPRVDVSMKVKTPAGWRRAPRLKFASGAASARQCYRAFNSANAAPVLLGAAELVLASLAALLRLVPLALRCVLNAHLRASGKSKCEDRHSSGGPLFYQGLPTAFATRS